MASDADDAENDNDKQRVAYGLCLAAGVVIVAGLAVYFLGPMYYLSALLRLLPEHAGFRWTLGWFFFIFFLAVLAVPIWPVICIVSGLVFGLGTGTALNFAALYAAAVVSTLLGKTLLEEPVRRWLDNGTFPLANRALRCLEEAEDSLEFLILFRFLFLPIWMRNYAPATLRIPIWKLLVAALPHTAWSSFIFASLGTSVQDAEELLAGSEKSWSSKWQNIAMFVVSFVTALLVTLYSYRKCQHLMSDESAPLLRKEP